MGEASFESGGYRDARSYLDNAKRQGALSGHSQSLLEWLNSEKAAAPLLHSKALRAVPGTVVENLVEHFYGNARLSL